MSETNTKTICCLGLVFFLVAGNAAGITVHEVLSNGFWFSTPRPSLSYLENNGNPLVKIIRRKEKEDIDGYHLYIVKVLRSRRGNTWKEKMYCNQFINKGKHIYNYNRRLRFRDDLYKSVSEIDENMYWQLMLMQNKALETNSTKIVHEWYKAFPRKKNNQPQGPYKAENWLQNMLNGWVEFSCICSEVIATTNIISDNEVYITGTIHQTGHIDEYDGYKVDEDTSLLRSYTQHITTDADHVYVEQEITEKAQNIPFYNSQEIYQTQYTATFKKGSWKSETETVIKNIQREISFWKLKYEQNE